MPLENEHQIIGSNLRVNGKEDTYYQSSKSYE